MNTSLKMSFKTRPYKSAILFSMAFLLGACNHSPKERTKVDVGYYSIRGSNWQELNKAIKRNGPKVNKQHALAAARIQMKPDVIYRKTDDGCEVVHAKIYIEAKIRLPKWRNPSKANAELQRNWGNYAAYAREHEETHVKIAEAYAAQAEAALLSLPLQPSCEVLKQHYKSIMSSMNKTHEKAQIQFDIDERMRIEKLVADAERASAFRR